MNKFFKTIIWFVIAAPAIYLALVWKNIPETVAIHFGLDGKPDRFGDKNEFLITCTVLISLSAIVYLAITNAWRVDPKKNAADNKSRLGKIAFAISVFLAAVCGLLIYSATHGQVKFNTGLMLAGVGLLFALIGNYMHNIKPNYFAGLRLPWTLENEDNWKKTHALAGRLWFAGGLIMAVLCLFLPPVAGIIVFFSITVIIITIPVVFSYRYYKQHQKTSL